MRKRQMTILLGILLFCVFTTGAVAQGFGIGVIAGEPSGISMKSGSFPVIGIGWSTILNRLDATVDMWIINEALADPFNWYLGVGGKLGLRFADDKDGGPVGLGVRVPVGLQWWLRGDIELFLELAPGLALLPSTVFDFGGGVGIRFYF